MRKAVDGQFEEAKAQKMVNGEVQMLAGLSQGRGMGLCLLWLMS